MAAEEMRRPGQSMNVLGVILVVLSVTLGVILGLVEAVPTPLLTGDEFNWTLALLVWGPLFVGGVVALAAGSIVNALTRE